MEIINLTPHAVNVNGTTIPPDGRVPRVSEWVEPTEEEVTLPDGAIAPIVTVRTGVVEGLPDQQPGVLLIVSRMVAEAAPHRRDLVVPHGLLRDEQGRVIGCTGFGRVPTGDPLNWSDPTFGGAEPYSFTELRISRVEASPVKAKVVAGGCPDHDGACYATATVVAEFGSADDAGNWAEDAARRAVTGTYARR